MTQLESYYDRWYEGTNLPATEGMVRPMSDFFSLASAAIDADLKEEKASSYEDLKIGANFRKFCQKYDKDVKGLFLFVYDHQGFYDRGRRFYNWRTLQPFADAVFRFQIAAPHKSRLLEVSGNFKLAIFALDDDDVCSYILSHFKVFADLPGTFEDKHGRKQTALEAIYNKLQEIKKGKPFDPGTPQWALEMVIKRFTYNL